MSFQESYIMLILKQTVFQYTGMQLPVLPAMCPRARSGRIVFSSHKKITIPYGMVIF